MLVCSVLLANDSDWPRTVSQPHVSEEEVQTEEGQIVLTLEGDASPRTTVGLVSSPTRHCQAAEAPLCE
jgi:hypothetical protein